MKNHPTPARWAAWGLLALLPLASFLCQKPADPPEAPAPYDPLPPAGEWRAAKGHVIGYNSCSYRTTSEASDWLILTDRGDSLFAINLWLDSLYQLPPVAFRDVAVGCVLSGILCPDYLQRYKITFEYRRPEPEEMPRFPCTFPGNNHPMARKRPVVITRRAMATEN